MEHHKSRSEAIMQLLGSKQQQPAMAPLPKWKPRRTLIDLYMERDQIQWHWTLAASLSAAFIMTGFLLFPVSFPNNPSQVSSSRSYAIAAGVLMAIGYVSSAVFALLRRSWFFQMDVVFVPCLLSSLLGLVNIAIALSIHHGTESLLNSSSLAALVLSIISSTTYLTLTLFTFRKIHIVRERDGMHRHRSDSESYHLLPEDEMQRQQLLRLLQRENNNKNQKPSPANASQSTFRIDLPDSPRRMETSLTAPRTVHESGRNDTHNSFKPRSLNFSPQSPSLSSIRRTPSPCEPLPAHEHEHDRPAPQPPHPPLDDSSIMPDRNFSKSSSRSAAPAAPPYTPGDVEAPIEKRGEIADLTGEVHPLERDWERERERARPQYRVVDAPPPPPAPSFGDDMSRYLSPNLQKKRDKAGRGPEMRRQRSMSRESRRVEIELERGTRNGAGERARAAELEGVSVSPRIMRVETDGWGGR
ncbi:MAG: hypothetical protein Q9185_002932 [Variospora sp. 1 TL-2023]